MTADQDRDSFRNRFGAPLRALNASVDLLNGLLRVVDQRFHALQEHDAELKRLLLEQSEELRTLGDEIRELRQRLDAGGPR